MRNNTKPLSIVLSILLLLSTVSNSYGYFENYDNKIITRPQIDQTPEIVQLPPHITQDHSLSRYLVFGHGSINDLELAPNLISSVSNNNGFFSIVVLPEQSIQSLTAKGYSVIKDFPLEFYQSTNDVQFFEMDKIRESTGSELAQIKYNYTGNGIKIAIVDTGVDFSNPDIKNSLARDEQNIPIMLDPDSQGLILTNATFAANINKYNVLENTTKPIIEKISKSLSQNITSNVYLNANGVFLNLKQNGKGTQVSIYNSFFPSTGPNPVFNGTIIDDYKIGKNKHDFIKSASGVYHFGMIYQGATQGPFTSVQVVPVLVVDSQIPGTYDTIIPDLSTSWKDYTKFDLKGQKPQYDFDFTDEIPIKIGDGNEFLVYDSDKDGKLDYSAGTLGAQIVDIYGIISQNKSSIDKSLKATNGTLLPPLDPRGNFFGIMTDFVGHGTSAVSSITSKGVEKYDIYNNTKKYTLPGVAPNAKIIPIKALWFGDTVYGWLWGAGFNNNNNTWNFSGKPRADIISNSWGISNFPSLKTSPGMDALSLIINVLSTPQSIDEKYPGVTIISSAGNAGHGYGTLGLPNAASFGITVGASTNNVYVGYGAFKGQPRFGNTTLHANDMADFSSRGPSIIGDPKPDLVNVGAYGFTPKNVLKKPNSKQEPFSMFGGTSMAAPLTAGSVAILMESLKEKNQDYDSFKIKNILLSTATDLQNDPFTQGAGLSNAYKAVSFVNGENGVFIVYNNSTYQNIKKIINAPTIKLNSTLGFSTFYLPDKTHSQTSWFAGRLSSGEKSSTLFTIENTNNNTLTIQIIPQKLELIQKSKFNSTTKLRLQDALYNKTGVYRPDYIKLVDVDVHDSLLSYYQNKTNPIPDDSSLMILNLNFNLNDFMNKTEKLYASDTKIASLYLYDWNDKDKNEKISSNELSMINKGGSWGTGQEIRVSNPKSKFDNTPLVGVYPVPTRYSYWLGDTKKNSTEMNYVLSVNYYKKQPWQEIWLDNNYVKIPPHETAHVVATVTIPNEIEPGLYQGFISFIGTNHTVNAPVSFAVTAEIKHKDEYTIISGASNSDPLYGNGYVKGAFDMINRYNAGDWRQYYFDVNDPSINSASFDVSWDDENTNLSIFMIDPQGRMIQTNMPPGVFGQFMDWPTSDWLGTSSFSEGGGFYPVKNKNNTSTLLYAPINQTGTYTLLMHSTLFGGKSSTEPLNVIGRFSSTHEDNNPPEIIFSIPEFVNTINTIPKITDESEFSAKYSIDNNEIIYENNTINSISEGQHQLQIQATDQYGNTSTEFYYFIIDRIPPIIHVKTPANHSKLSENAFVEFLVNDDNLDDLKTSVQLPNGTIIQNKTILEFDTKNSSNNSILITAQDKAGNKSQKILFFDLDKKNTQTKSQETQFDSNLLLMVISGVIAIAIATFIVFMNKSRKSS